MKLFKINNKISIVAKFEKTRNGFRHRATLLLNGRDVDEKTESYLNRTWEAYEFQTVLHSLINKTKYLNPVEKVKALAKLG